MKKIIKKIVIESEIWWISASLDNITFGVYLFDVGLRHVYSVLSFSERNKANIFSFNLMSNKLFSKIWQKKKEFFLNVNWSFQAAVHRIVTYSMLVYSTYLLYYHPPTEKKPKF